MKYQCYSLNREILDAIEKGKNREELHDLVLERHGKNGGFESRTTVEMKIMKNNILLLTFIYLILSIMTNGAEHSFVEHSYVKDNQILWGTWKITAKMYGGGMGWQSCQDEYQGIEFGFTPDSFYYDGETVEVDVYEANVFAVSEEHTFHGWGFDQLGVNGDYIIDLEFKEDICPFFFTIISDKEMLLTVGRLMYKAEKVENAEYNCETAFIVCPYFDLCYGEWEIVQKVNIFDNFYQNIHIGEVVEIGYEWKGRGNGYDMYIKRTNPKIEIEEEIHQGFSYNEESEDYYRPFITFDIMGWNDRQNALLEKGDNSFIVCYNLPEDFYWDKILARDDMTVYFIKNNECYMAKRISDPVGIYTIKNESTTERFKVCAWKSEII